MWEINQGLNDHLIKHQEYLKNAMVCNQPSHKLKIMASFPGEVDVSGCKEDPTRKLVKGKVEKLRPSVLAPGFFKG